MKKIISIIGSIIVVLAVIYFGVTYYVTHQAKSWVKQASSAIQAEFPQVQSIDYQNIHASVLGLFSDRFTLHHLSIRLKGINVPVVVSQLTLTGISALSHKPTGNVTITAQGIHLNTLKAFLINQSQQSHDKQQQTWIEQIPASFNPNISITVRYDNDTHQVWINGSLSNQHHTYFTKNTTLDHAILNNLHETTAIEQALQQAYVSQSTSGVHINVDNIQLGKDNPEQDALLKQFGLETVSVHINGDGVYQDSDRMTHSQLMITASKLFTLKTHSTTHLNERLYLKPLIKWLNTPSKQRPALHLDEMIHHFSLTYQDQGLMPLLFNHVAPMIGGVQPSIAKRNIMNVLMAISVHYPSTQLKQIIKQINQFILTPQALTVSLSPQPPMSYGAIKAFLGKLKQQNTVAQQALQQEEQQYRAKTGKPLPKAEHDAMVKHYQSLVAQQIELFLKRVGLSVTAK